MYTLFIISIKHIEAEIHFKNKRNSSIKHISKINSTKVSARKKNHPRKKIMKDNSKHNRKTVGKRYAWDVTNMLKSRNCTQKKHTTNKKKTKTQSQ